MMKIANNLFFEMVSNDFQIQFNEKIDLIVNRDDLKTISYRNLQEFKLLKFCK